MTDIHGILARALRIPVARLAAGDLQPVRVAVLDSGIDATHPDLTGRVERAVICRTEAGGETVSSEADPAANNDAYGHGTAVASILARIAPNVRLTDIRVLGNARANAADALLAGVALANETEAAVMNISVAVGEAYLPRLGRLADRAYRRGKIVVAATRNRPVEDDGYPASIVHCVGVGNAGRGPQDVWRYRREVIEFMGHGTDVTVAAAGGGYTSQTGTSFATPMVCGIVSLMLGAHPGLTPFEVKALLKAFAAEAD